MAKKRRFKKRARPSFRGFRYKRLYSRFEALYKLLAMLGVSALLSSVVYAVIYRSVEGYAAPIAVLFGTGGLLFGYGMSAFWGTVTSCERVRSEYSYERLDSYFDKGVLFLSALTAALACFGVYKVAYGLSGTVTASGLVLRDSADMLPAVVTAVFGGCLLCGVLLWFIPYNKVISVGNAIPLGLVFFIVMLITAIYMQADVIFVTAAFALYVLCAMTVVSQGYLIRIIAESGTGSATSAVRRYNFAAVLLAYAALALAGVGVTSVFVGIAVLFRIFARTFFKGLFDRETGLGGRPSASGGGAVSESVFGEIMGMESEATNVFFLVIFVLLFIGAIAYAAVRIAGKKKRLPKMSEIISWLYSVLLRIGSFIIGLFTGKTLAEDDIILEDYADEELKMSADTEGVPDTDSKNGLKKFRRMLAACRNNGERLALCYKVQRAGYIREYRLLRVGDTPAELAGKLNGLLPELEAERFKRLTELYSDMAYAGKMPSETENLEALLSI